MEAGGQSGVNWKDLLARRGSSTLRMVMSFTLNWLAEETRPSFAFFVLALLCGSAVFAAFRARALAQATS